MTRQSLLSFAALALVGTGGCQSGHVWGVQSSTDGKVIAFQDGGLYVADSKGVRFLKDTHDYVLSPDGHWLVTTVKTGSFWDYGQWFEDGSLLLLFDLRTDKVYSTRVPIIEGSSEPRVPLTTPQPASQPSTSPASDESPVRAESIICFGPDPQLTYGPRAGYYWTWEPEDKSGVVWTKIPADFPTAAIPPGGITVAFDISAHVIKDPTFIVTLPCDGWNAPRSVWVRPDGSVVELSRMNHIPGYCAFFTPVVVVALPFAVVVDGVFLVCDPELTGEATRGVLFGQPHMYMKAAFKELEVDQGKLKEAQDELQRQIDQRRAAASSQPTTAPDR
jgi:hypothetical protein